MTTIQNMLADMRRELMSANPPLGVSTTPAEGFRTHRFESEVPLSCSTGEIAVSFILSGVKTVTVGGRVFFLRCRGRTALRRRAAKYFSSDAREPRRTFLIGFFGA